MKKQLISCIRKDMKEYIRSRKNVVFALTVLAISVFVFGATKLLPPLIETLVAKAESMVSNPDTISETLATLFPQDTKGNLGIWASNVTIFYGIIVVLLTYRLVVKEIRSGKWIFPLSVGYKPSVLIVSKGIVYGFGAAIPAIIFYNLYYFMANLYLTPNYAFSSALTNSIVLGIAIFVSVYSAILMGAIFKQPVFSAVTVLGIIVVVPDILTLFSFGKYLPTYIFTHIYTSSTNIISLIIPLLLIIIIEILLTFWAVKRSKKIEISL